MTDLASIITSIAGALAACGGGIAWLWTRIEARFKQVEAKLSACEQRELRQTRINGVQLTVIELLWQEARRFNPGDGSPVLERSQKLMDDLKREVK